MKVNDDGKSIRDAIKELKITEAQANRLDELDGIDGLIGKSIFSIASSVKKGIVPMYANRDLISKVKDILEIQVPFASLSKAEYKEYQEVQKKQDFEKDIKAEYKEYQEVQKKQDFEKDIKAGVLDDSTVSPKVKQLVKEIAEGKRRLGNEFVIPNKTEGKEVNNRVVQNKIDSEEKVYYLLALFEDFNTGMPNYTLSKADRQYIYNLIMNSQFIKDNHNSTVAKEYIQYAKEAISDEYMNREEPEVYR